MITLPDVLAALARAPAQGGRYPSTDPPLRPTEGLPCRPVGVPPGASPAYAQRTTERHAALQQLDELCFWHLHLIEVPASFRAITAARRELHIRLREDQRKDDQSQTKEK
jgi:hypothetical protein